MMGSEGISVADALALRTTGNDNDGFGGGNGWWIVLLILLFAGRGWGNGFGGNNGGYSACCTPATHQGMTDAFNFNQLDNGIRGIEQGICNGFYTTAQNINGVQAALADCCCQNKLGMCEGFGGVNQNIANLGYQVAQGFCGVDKTIMQGDFHNQFPCLWKT